MIKDIAIKIFVGKQQFQKGTFVYFIFLNANKFESLRPAMPKTIVASLYSFEFRCLTWFTKHELHKACSSERGSENTFERM